MEALESGTAVTVPVNVSRPSFHPFGSPNRNRRLTNTRCVDGGRGMLRTMSARSTFSSTIRCRSVSPREGYKYSPTFFSAF